jgi:hypothetical protein
MKLRVECYAGAKADERPVRFQLGERDYMVDEVLDQWYGPDDVFFKVRTDDGNLYILRCNTSADEWTLESFPEAQRLVGGRVAGWERFFRSFVDTGVPFRPKNLLFCLEPVVDFRTRLVAAQDIEFVSTSVDSFC